MSNKIISDNAKILKAAAKEVVAISRSENVQHYTWRTKVSRGTSLPKRHIGTEGWERLTKSTKWCFYYVESY